MIRIVRITARLGKRVAGVAGVTALMALAACVEPTEGLSRAEILNDGARAQFDVFFEPGGGRLATGEVQRLRSFLGGLGLRAEDDIFLYPAWTGSPRLDGERAAALRAALPRVPSRVILAGRTGFDGTRAPANAGLVQVVRYDTTRIVCPRNEDPWIFPNIGCSNATNLAVQASEMRDLTAPGTLNPSGAEIPAAVVLRERAGQTPPVTLGNMSTASGG